MRIALLSDIHGNTLALDAVLYDREAVIEELKRVKHPTVEFLAKFMHGEIIAPWAQQGRG